MGGDVLELVMRNAGVVSYLHLGCRIAPEKRKYGHPLLNAGIDEGRLWNGEMRTSKKDVDREGP